MLVVQSSNEHGVIRLRKKEQKKTNYIFFSAGANFIPVCVVTVVLMPHITALVSHAVIWFPAQRLTQSPLHPQKLKSKSMLISWWNLVIVWHMLQNTWFARTFWPTINPHWCIARVTRFMMRLISVSSTSSSTYINTFAWPDVSLQAFCVLLQL